MKKLQVQACLPKVETRLSKDNETSEGEGTIYCLNMRPSSVNASLAVVAEDFEQTGSSVKGGRLLGHYAGAEGRLITAIGEGHALKVMTEQGPEGPDVSYTSDLDSAAELLVPVGGDKAIVMTANDVYSMDAEGCRRMSEIPPCGMTIVEAGPETRQQSGGASLHGAYNRESTTLSDSDSRTLAKAVLDAYRKIVEKSEHAGYSVSPFLMRYRYLDSSGNTLYVSPIKAMTSVSASRMSDELTCIAGESVRGPFTLREKTFRAIVYFPHDEEWKDRVQSVAIETTPPLPVADFNSQGCENRLSLSDSTLRFYVPGMSTDMGADLVCRSERLLSMFRHFDDLCGTVCQISDPFGSNSGQRTLVGPYRDISEDIADTDRRTLQRLKTLNERSAVRDAGTGGGLSSFVAPHSFVAGCGAVSGGSVMWGDIRRKMWHGWDIREWCVGTEESGTWHGCVWVEFGTAGRRAVWSGEGTDEVPSLLAPLLHFPSEDATAMELRVKTSWGVAVYRTELRGIPGSGSAVSVSGSLTPERLYFDVGEDYYVPMDTVEDTFHPDVVLCCAIEHPLAVTDVRRTGREGLCAIEGCASGSSAWDYVRDRFYLFGRGGIMQAVVNARNEITSLHSIDGCEVTSKRHISRGTGNNSFTVFSGGGLRRLSGGKCERLPGYVPPDVDSIGHDGDDLWLHSPSEGIYVRPGCCPGRHYLRNSPQIGDMLTDGNGHLHIIDDEGRLLDSRRRYTADKEIEWSCRIGVGDVVKPPVRGTVSTFVRLTAVGLRLVCTAIKARFIATSDCGSASSALARILMSALLEGCLKSDLFLPMRCSQRQWVVLTLKGLVSADTRLRGATIFVEQ